ncbi:MAG: DUF4249 family protein [Flavobacteriales bacterium]|nr:DUF4249 family protein [Flavobacteriales bacterium]
MFRPLAIVATAALLFIGCTNDLEINDDYSDHTIIYGLLNQRDSVHLVKINKAFLGEGSAFDMALVQDSNEYRNEAISYAKVFRLDANGNAIDSFPLHDTIITDREPGEFYSPVQKLSYFTTPFVQRIPNIATGSRMYLHQDQTYRLHLRVNGKDITSTCPIVNDFSIDPVDQDTGSTFGSRVNLMNAQGTDYGSYEFNWKSKQDCKRFVVSFRFRYDEVTGTDTVRTSFTQFLGKQVSTNSQVFQDLSVTMGGQLFFSGLSTYIRSNPDWTSVNKRIFRGLDFLVSVANDDFHTYLTLTEPISGIIEDRPAYSNVDGALGIWGSRYTKNVVGKRLGGSTLTQLVQGPYTADLHFCSALDAGGAFSCN